MNTGLHTQKTQIQVGDLNKTTAPATCLIQIDSKTGSDFNNQKMGAPWVYQDVLWYVLCIS